MAASAACGSLALNLPRHRPADAVAAPAATGAPSAEPVG